MISLLSIARSPSRTTETKRYNILQIYLLLFSILFCIKITNAWTLSNNNQKQGISPISQEQQRAELIECAKDIDNDLANGESKGKYLKSNNNRI